MRRPRFIGDKGRIQDNGRTVRHQRKRLLHNEKQSLHMSVQDRVIVLFRNTGVRKNNVEPALFLLDLCEQTIEITRFDTSTCASVTLLPRLSIAAISSGARRPAMKTYAPSFTNRLAAASPIASLIDVISAIFPSSFPMHLLLFSYLSLWKFVSVVLAS